MLGFETVGKYIERNIIEVAPLAFMRGRTLNNAFIILDEAQNTTREQMKMFLTRLALAPRPLLQVTRRKSISLAANPRDLSTRLRYLTA